MIVLSTFRACLRGSDGSFRLSRHIRDSTFDVLVVAGGLGAPIAAAIKLLGTVGCPVFLVLSEHDCEGLSYEEANLLASAEADRLNVYPLDQELLVYKGVRFFGSRIVNGVDPWLEEALTAARHLPAVVISSGNPFLPADEAFLAGRRLLSAAPPSAASNSCYAWIYGGSSIASMRLSSDGVALVACSGHLGRPAYGAQPSPFNVFTIREDLQVVSLAHIRSLVEAGTRAVRGRMGQLRGDEDELALITHELCNSLQLEFARQPYLSYCCHLSLLNARTAFVQSRFSDGLDALSLLCSAPLAELVLNRPILANARAKARSLLEALLQAEQISYLVHPLTHPETFLMHSQPLRVQVFTKADAGDRAALDRYLESVTAATHSMLRKDFPLPAPGSEGLPVHVQLFI